MTSLRFPAIALMAVVIGVSGPVFSGDWHNASVPNSTYTSNDGTGRYDLGIDITTAGSTPANIPGFLSTLEPRIREIVIATCHDMVGDPVGHVPSVVSFCRTIGL
jgi:hypothetical protein